jgi:hypothetical protein
MFPGVRACFRGQSLFSGSEHMFLRGQSMFPRLRACSRGQSVFLFSGSEHVPPAQSMFPGSEHVSRASARTMRNIWIPAFAGMTRTSGTPAGMTDSFSVFSAALCENR